MQLPRFAAVILLLGVATASSAATLDRIKESGHIRLGYLADARPFTYSSSAGAVDGYAAALCQRIAAQVKTELGLAELALDWVPVEADDRLSAIQQGQIDVLCVPTSVTLSRRRETSFSIPVFPGGVRAALRADAPKALRDALSETTPTRPVWRGSPAAKTLEGTTVAVVTGSTTEGWVKNRIGALQIGARVTPVPDHRTGLQQLLDRKVDIFFGDRPAILGAADPARGGEFIFLDRLFTQEPYALALARGDEDFRLTADRALSALYASGDMSELYSKWFGDFGTATRAFFLWNTVPQ